MSITIKALSPELINDFFDFFDNRAFSDGSPFYPCYCNAFNMSLEQIKTQLFARSELYGKGAEGWKRVLRSSAWEMVKSGAIQGYLAYDDELAVGWCNANDRMNYYRVGEFDMDNIPEDRPPLGCSEKGIVKSVVCFEISPDHRGRGIAGMLLAQVCKTQLMKDTPLLKPILKISPKTAVWLSQDRFAFMRDPASGNIAVPVPLLL